MYDGSARWLNNRIVSGLHPAILDLKTKDVNGRDVITQGVATWPGQSLDVCQSQIDEWGLQSFLEEAQHEVYNIDYQAGKAELEKLSLVTDTRTTL